MRTRGWVGPATLTTLLVVLTARQPALGADPMASKNNAQVSRDSLGSPAVDSTGAFTYGIPIEVPRARGPIPDLRLAYNSNLENGVAGAGWQLSGLPAIVRVTNNAGAPFGGTETYAFAAGGINEVPQPRDWLVSKSATRYLLAFNGPGRLREFERVGSCGMGPCSWRMRDGAGTTYFFGAFDDTPTNVTIGLMEPNNGVTSGRGVAAYPLTEVMDADGNFFRVTYLATGSSMVPRSIDYNLPRPAASDRSLQVFFDYESRLDSTSMPFPTTLRLHRILVAGDCLATCGTSISELRLAYQESSHTGRSLLSTLTRFSPSGASLDPITLNYTQGGTPPQLVSPAATKFKNVPFVSLLGDIDGDGRSELVRVHSAADGEVVQFACGTATGFGSVQTLVNSLPLLNQPTYHPTLADFNGDGLDDLALVLPDTTHQFATGGPPNTTGILLRVAFGKPNCAMTPPVAQATIYLPNSVLSATAMNWQLLPGDFDGDGRSDLALYGSRAGGYTESPLDRIVIAYRSTGSTDGVALGAGAWFSPRASTWTQCSPAMPALSGFAGIRLADINGDQRADLVALWYGAGRSGHRRRS